MDEGSNQSAEVRSVQPRHRDEWGIEFSRIVAFSDGVFAIAITLLVLQLGIPEHLPAGSTLFEEIVDQEGDLIAYGISFAVLGKLWLSHHRFFSAVERFDSVLMALNLLYLAWIVLVPFTSEVLGDYGDDPAGVITYAAIMSAVSLTFQAQIMYAFRNGLLRPQLREVEQRVIGPANFLFAAVFMLSIPVALVSPLAAILMWSVIFLTGGRLGARLSKMRA
jgi:uncharacterized membrane protein